MVIVLYKDEIDKRLHFDQINNLSHDLNVPLEDLKLLYEGELMNLKAKATITIFLPIFVRRRIRELLSSRYSS
jgi:hypothetical protein